MRYMLLQDYAPAANCDLPMPEWDPEEIEAHIAFQQALNEELLSTGELVEANGLAGPEAVRTVVWTGTGSPVITDGPFPESKEVVAGYRLVDVESEDRALEIAAKSSAAPGPKGVGMGVRIEVRRVLSAPAPEVP